jgi:RNA 3'-terminal phosphate cyclase
MSAAARESLGDLGPAQIETQLLGEAEAVGRGGAVVVVARTENGVLGAGNVAERGVPAERLGSEVGWELRRDLEGGAGVDIHAADQLLIYAAQATRPSVFTVRHVSLHAATVMWLTEQFLPARFSTSPWRVLQRIEVSPDRA